MTVHRPRPPRALLLAAALVARRGRFRLCLRARVPGSAGLRACAQHWDMAVMAYQKAASLEPGNQKYTTALFRSRLQAAQTHLGRGRLHRSAGQLDLAQVELEQSVALDPTNDVAHQELKKVVAEIEARRLEAAGGSPTEKAKAKAKGRRAAPPMLNPASDKPIDVSFPPDTPIKKIYQALCTASGINVIFDPQLKDDKFTIDLRNLTFQKALETTMRQAGHFYKVIDEKTILVAQDTQQNRKEYEDQVVRTFFLSNGDVKDVSAMVRGLLDLRRMATVTQLNAIVIRDTADKVAVAERLIEVNDKAKAEVVLDVELLQLSTKKLLDLGVALSSYSITGTYDRSTATGAPAGARRRPLPWDELHQALALRLQLHGPVDHHQLHQDEHRGGGPGPAAAADRRGGEGPARHRQPRPDPGHDDQHAAGDRADRRRPGDVVPVPGRRHQARRRDARPPQQGGLAQADRRGLEPERLRATAGTARSSRSSARGRSRRTSG